MAGKKKLASWEAFEDSISDARSLAALAGSLGNRRVRRMRAELRDRIGEALRVTRKARAGLDCVESTDLFLVIKPKARMTRRDFTDEALRPLLRQALVASCTALETYVGDRVMESVGSTVRSNNVPSKLREIRMTVGDHLSILESYQRTGWGLRPIIERAVRDVASPAPAQVEKAFALIGKDNVLHQVDRKLGQKGGAAQSALQKIYDRRNRIAHSGDRVGRGRAHITVAEVNADIDALERIARAIHAIR